MRSTTALGNAFRIAAGAAMLAAGLGIGKVPAAHSPTREPAGVAAAGVASSVAFVVSDQGSNDVFAYGIEGRLVAVITGLKGPRGVAIGAAGEVYIANSEGGNIVVYKNDYRTPLAALDDTGEFPVGVSYDRSSGTVAVVNAAVKAHQPNITFYARGTTKPCARLSNSTFNSAFYGAFDAAGNFYFEGYSSGYAFLIGAISGGCKGRSISLVSTSNALGAPGGIQVEAGGAVAVADANARAIYTYKPPVNGSLGSPILTTPLALNVSVDGFAFANDERDVWVVDSVGEATSEYRYPAGGAPLKSIAQFNPTGVAVTPLGQKGRSQP